MAFELVIQALGRPLEPDEFLAAERMASLGKTEDEIVQVLRELERPVLSDDELPVHRYEPSIEQAREIP